MTNTPYLLIAFLTGAGIGVFYFGGLWWTVRRLPASRRPGLWTLGSFFVRTGFSLFGFYLVMGGHWERLLISLVGFVLMRGILVRRWQPKSKQTEF
jgi:F1F0 ATPase subunit 2